MVAESSKIMILSWTDCYRKVQFNSELTLVQIHYKIESIRANTDKTAAINSNCNSD